MSAALEPGLPPAPGRNQVAEVKTIEGKISVRLAAGRAGTWLSFNSPIDSVIAHIQRELGLDRYRVGIVLEAICVDAGAVSRARKTPGIPEHWLLRMHDYSGIPVSELRLVAGIEAAISPHRAARRPA